MQPFLADAVYVNYLGDEGEERVRSAHRPATYARLSALKKKYAWIAYPPRKCQWFLEPSACVEKLWKQNLLKIFLRMPVCRRSVDPIFAQLLGHYYIGPVEID
jgi:hypothetical protein